MLGVLGVGRMGAAIAAGLLERGFCAAADLAVYDRDRRRGEAFAAACPGVGVQPTAAALAAAVETLVVAVKPQDRAAAVAAIAAADRRPRLVVSILAGVPTTWFAGCLPDLPLVRAMPNLGVRAGAGHTYLAAGSAAGAREVAAAGRLFGVLGTVEEVPEARLDVLTALSGSGPAYYFLLMEVMAAFAVREAGLDQDGARRAAQAAATAAAALARGEDPAALKAEVASPGGTTEAALAVLEAGGIRELFDRALAAAVRRGRELADPPARC